MVSQAASLDAVHVHSRAVETETEPVPPAAATVEAPVRAMAHRVPDGLVTVLVDEPHPAMAASAATAKRVDPFTVDRDARARPNARHAEARVLLRGGRVGWELTGVVGSSSAGYRNSIPLQPIAQALPGLARVVNG